MTEDLLSYYNRELRYFRKLSQEFSQANPTEAAYLKLDAQTGQDPYVERMIEAFAYINARTRKKLEDDFPEITEAMLGALYPHYLAPIPSMAIAQFELDPGQAGMVAGYPIPRGAGLESDVDGEVCKFRTCYPLHLFPVSVSNASLGSLKNAPAIVRYDQPVAPLRIKLTTFGEEAPLSKMSMTSLQFFLAGDPGHVNALFELICSHVVAATLESGPDDKHPVLLDKRSLQPMGYDAEQGLLPYDARAFRGYRLLTDYFTLPQKFQFFEVANLNEQILSKLGTSVDLVLYVKQVTDELQRNTEADNFRMGCTPIVNLFEQRADPFSLSSFQSQYHLVPDVRRTETMEVYSIDRVTATGRDGQAVTVHPFYSVSHNVNRDQQTAYWYASRREAESVGNRRDSGTEMDITFVDLDFSPAALPKDWTIEVTTTCLNRDLPAQLVFGRDQPRLTMLKGGPLAPVGCLTPPTPTRRPALKHGALWRLVSHLSLNHLSLVEGADGAAALREILSLYDFVGTPDLTGKVDGILDVTSSRQTARVVSGDICGFCRGVEVAIEFDEDRFADNGLFLFASVLERFLGLYCSINSFSRLVAKSKQREGVVYRWPPRAADKQLL